MAGMTEADRNGNVRGKKKKKKKKATVRRENAVPEPTGTTFARYMSCSAQIRAGETRGFAWEKTMASTLFPSSLPQTAALTHKHSNGTSYGKKRGNFH